MDKEVRIIVKGRVQGVFFRDSTRRQAQSLGLKGIVRNSADGSVEILAQGDETKLEKLKRWCWEGSPNSQVNSVIVQEVNDLHDLQSFKISY